MLECYTKKTSRAKKKHTCLLCGRTIEIGEEYIIYKGKTSYGWFYDIYHTECQKIIDEFLGENNEDEYSQESINEWLYDSRCYDCDKYDREIGECICDGIVFPLDCPKIKKEFGETEEAKHELT